MTLRQLEYLLAVVEERSFTRAAKRLLVSQPALSQQIRALEASLGGPLLERLPGTVRLTPLGNDFLPHAVATVNRSDAATRAARAVGRLELGDLWVATLQSIAIGIIPDAIRVWRRAHPLVNVQIREFSHVDLIAAFMARGDADVAVGPVPERWEGPWWPVGPEDLVVVLPAGDPELTGDGRPIDLRRLADRPWVLYAPEFGLAPTVNRACANAGFTPRAAVHTHHTTTAVDFAIAGLGPALVPQSVIRPDQRSCTVRADPPIRRHLAAFTRPAPSPSALAFIEIVGEHATLEGAFDATPGR